jgi:hypothetical protein
MMSPAPPPAGKPPAQPQREAAGAADDRVRAATGGPAGTVRSLPRHWMKH